MLLSNKETNSKKKSKGNLRYCINFWSVPFLPALSSSSFFKFRAFKETLRNHKYSKTPTIIIVILTTQCQV